MHVAPCTQVSALFAVAKLKQPSVIFIDEIDSILTKRKEGGRLLSRLPALLLPAPLLVQDAMAHPTGTRPDYTASVHTNTCNCNRGCRTGLQIERTARLSHSQYNQNNCGLI